ncbi:PREDICTED: zinc finger protein 830-like [Camelina sativa]|uniref:Zinc finger protein 830-like n=1 Tax=Camelina sativa TaxID=90675 RepID=A0ABM0VZT5_CAMSA|nr:PREDICTED: zinc finger protein 830-like [Camelina sativa]
MDAQAKKKAMFRSKLNAKKKDTRIDSPLVRYNESDQPVCRVCNVVLKSESLWDVHQASRKHHEAIDNLKASAAGVQRGSKPAATQPAKSETFAKPSKPQTSSALPPNFFENREPARESGEVELENSKNIQQSKQSTGSETSKTKGPLPAGFFDNQITDSSNTNTTSEPQESQTQTTGGSETKPAVKGALPSGFFDNKEADLLARGIKLVKPDIKDEYKEFEKLIQEDLQVVDSRMEEEEVDAAETIEEEEQREQRSYNEKVEILKRRKMELKAARLAKRSKTSEGSVKKPKKTEEESSSDEEDDEVSAVDWRAQHL